MRAGIVEQTAAEAERVLTREVDEFEELLKKPRRRLSDFEELLERRPFGPSDFEELLRKPRHPPLPDKVEQLLRRTLPKVLRELAKKAGPLGGIIDILTPSPLGSGELPGGPGSANETQPEGEPPRAPPRRTTLPTPLPAPAPQPEGEADQDIEEIVVTGRRTAPLPIPRPGPISRPGPLQTAGIALGALTGLALLRRRRQSAPSPRPRAAREPASEAAPTPLPRPSPAPAPSPVPQPSPRPEPAPAPSPSSPPGLTPPNVPGAGCTPCDPKASRRDQKRKRDEKRKQCRQFLSVRVPAHKRKMCIADLAKYLQRKLERTAKAALRKKIVAALEAQGVPASSLIKATRRPRRPKAEIDVGGVEIDLEDLLGSK